MKLVTVLANQDCFSCPGRQFAHQQSTARSFYDEIWGFLPHVRSTVVIGTIFKGSIKFDGSHIHLPPIANRGLGNDSTQNEHDDPNRNGFYFRSLFLSATPLRGDKFNNLVGIVVAYQRQGISSLLYDANLIDQHLAIKCDAAV